jgi:hypothetical protein
MPHYTLFEKAPYSLISARNDVSLKDPNQIVKEINEKYKNGEDIINFYEKKFLRGDNPFDWHLSPLGLVWNRGCLYDHKFKGQGMYSMRHVLEGDVELFGPKEGKKQFYDMLSKISNLYKVPEFKEFEIKENVYWDLKDGKLKKQKIYIQEEPDGLGFYVIWDNVSRVATHQLVRHQSFDYQQQSQRYINYAKKGVGGFYVPSAFRKDAITLGNYIEKVEEDFERYKQLVEEGVKPEDARYLLPNAFTSRIFIFMPKYRLCGRDGIKEFIEKRKYHGQEEIKNFAKTLEFIINNKLFI